MAEKRYKYSDDYQRKQAYRPHTYNNTSSAYDYAHEEEVTPQPKIKRIKRVRRGTKEVYVKAIDEAAKPTFAMFTAMAVIVTSAVISIVAYSLAATQTLKNSQLRAELKAMQSRTNDLAVEASQSMDLEQIEFIARTRLEMSEPQGHQIVYINVPKQDYTVHLPDTDDMAYAQAEADFSGFASLKNLFKKD